MNFCQVIVCFDDEADATKLNHDSIEAAFLGSGFPSMNGTIERALDNEMVILDFENNHINGEAQIVVFFKFLANLFKSEDGFTEGITTVMLAGDQSDVPVSTFKGMEWGFVDIDRFLLTP